MKKVYIVILSIFMLFLTGCSTAESPDKVLSKYLESMKKTDYTTAVTYLSKNNDQSDSLITGKGDESGEAIMKSLMSKITYETPVLGKKEKEAATVKVKITSPDMTRITGSVMSQAIGVAFASAFSQNANKTDTNTYMNQLFINSINDPNCPMTTTDATINFIKEDNQWKIQNNKENSTALVNALTGNMETAFSGISKSMGSDKK